MHDRVKNLVRVFQDGHKFHQWAYEILLQSKGLLKGGATPADLVDASFTLKEFIAVIEDIRKEAAALKDVIDKACAVLWSTGTDGGPIRAEFATGTPTIGQMASLPRLKQDPKKYAALMDFLGVPDHLQSVVRAHWPTMTEMLTERAARGLPFPPGIDPTKTYPTYKLATRKKSGVELLHVDVSK